MSTRYRTLLLFCSLALLPLSLSARQATRLDSDMPKTFTPVRDSYDFERREVEIRMRDGVRLHTVILVPKGVQRAPMLLTRTPYNADAMTERSNSNQLESTLKGYDNFPELSTEFGYIRVIQDVRGKHRSEGDYVVNRPLRGPLNPTRVDHATDTWDTVDWLSKNVPESNGNVGILGISYNGFTAAMGLIDPHPKLKVAVPMNPMVDSWRGDDWFHNGAFRQMMLPFIYNQVGTRAGKHRWWSSHQDQYDLYLEAGSAGALAKARGMEQIGFFRSLLQHPAYDAFWQGQAVDKLLASRPLTIPVMLVHSQWDQEDIYGDMAIYDALEPKDTGNDKVFLVIGPWNHGGQQERASNLGAIEFGIDTARTFRREILRPFLDQYLKDDAPKADIAPVTAFRTGDNQWDRLPAWPAGCASGCSVQQRPIYLQANAGLGFQAPATASEAEYVSDPAKPVPFTSRPVQPIGGDQWPKWLVDDQREAASRTDVLTFVSEPLTEPLQISGPPQVALTLSTNGSDGDFVVKLIDVHPALVPEQPEMGGYQMMLSADILRGRYRESFEHPSPIPPNTPIAIRYALPHVHHTFLRGHRVMVQVQSSWFPLYDRNPQTYVDNIFLAQPGDYRKATIKLAIGGAQGSAVVLPVVAKTTP
ncbi:CocE/NonD family hydrolase [Luteimonas sp. RIT-PG2_3]